MSGLDERWFAMPETVSAIRQAAEILGQEQTGKHSELVQALKDIADSLEQHAMLPEPMLESFCSYPGQCFNCDRAGSNCGRCMVDSPFWEPVNEDNDQNFLDIMRGMGWP